MKRVFEKGYEPNYNEEAFTVAQCLKRTPFVYRIKEFQKINKIDDVYIVERVLKTKKCKGKTMYLVK